MQGFSYRGIHLSQNGCSYRPDAKARGDGMEDYEVSDQTTDARDGGYFIGTRVKNREFALDCYFEDITPDMQEGIYRWLDRRSSGKLIFDDKPNICYEVHPAKRIQISLYDHIAPDGSKLHSGTFTAYFTCYEPFGRLMCNAYDGDCSETELSCTGILPAAIMPPAPTVNSTSFLLYNPGTEAAHTIIRLAGDVGEGLLIRNLTTGQRCQITGLTGTSLQPGALLALDSEKGQTRSELGDESTLAFAFHDEGYITLAPCTPFTRAVSVSHTAGSNIVTSNGLFKPHMKGQYLHLSEWVKINVVTDANTAVVGRNADSTGMCIAPIVTMNEIELSGADAALTRLEMAYYPRVR